MDELVKIVEIQHELLKDLVNTWNPEVTKKMKELSSLIESVKEKQKQSNE